MQLSLEQAAERMGKSVRQVRYLIQSGSLRATKSGGRWVIDAADLPLSDNQRAAVGRRENALRGAVEKGLGLDGATATRYSIRDLTAFQIALPLYRKGGELLGAEHPAVAALHSSLVLLTQGCHRFGHAEKAECYRAARDAASLALCEMVMADRGELEPLITDIEQDLMAAMSGLLRRLDRKPGRERP